MLPLLPLYCERPWVVGHVNVFLTGWKDSHFFKTRKTMCKNKGVYCLNDSEAFDGYCSYCYKNGYDEAKLPKEPYKIPKESKKRAKQNRIDRKQNKEIISERPLCEMKLPGCTRYAEGVQHVRGRVGKRLTDKQNKIPACNHCNRRAETHPKEAREKKVAKSRLSKN